MPLYNAAKLYNRLMSDSGTKYNSSPFYVEIMDTATGTDACKLNAMLVINDTGVGVDNDAELTIYPAMKPSTYVSKFLYSKGQMCLINRKPTFVASYVSIKRSTRSTRDLGVREAYWEGLILAESNLESGEVITINADNYLVQSVDIDSASGEYAFFAAKCNIVLQHKRHVAEGHDENNNIIKSWHTVNADVPAYGEVVTYRLRQEDPGLLDQTKYIMQVPKVIGVDKLDRIVFENSNYQVESIDHIALKGVVRLQLGIDLRPD